MKKFTLVLTGLLIGFLSIAGKGETEQPQKVEKVEHFSVRNTKEFYFWPESVNFYIYPMYPNKKYTSNLSLYNFNDFPLNWELRVNYSLPLQALGWDYGSTPLGGNITSGILMESPDQAMFIKDFTLGNDFNQAILRLAYDDAIRVWINGILAFDNIFGDQGINYWQDEVDVTGYLNPGTNRIAVVVFNGVLYGCCIGGFDCELEVDGEFPIKRGDENFGAPEAMWFYYGQIGQRLEPPRDIKDREWYDKDYGRYEWLKINQNKIPEVENEFSMLKWKYLSAPFGGENILSSGPDAAYFIKDIYVNNPQQTTLLYLSFDDGCMVYINGNLVLDFSLFHHGADYWNQIVDITGALTAGWNRISIVVFNGVYGGCCLGYFDAMLEVGGEMLIGPGIQYPNDPVASWYVFGEGGKFYEPSLDSEGRSWFAGDYATGSGNSFLAFGWEHRYTPISGGNQRNLYLTRFPDNLFLVKDITIEEFNEATLYLAYDDGCRVWINGNLEFDFSNEIHDMLYWNQVLDVSTLLQPGVNRIAIEVYNGVYAGWGLGGFDCQLIVDGVEVIKRGDENFYAPEARWYMYGKADQLTPPPVDFQGNMWYSTEYGKSAQPPANVLQGTLTPELPEDYVNIIVDTEGLDEGYYEGSLILQVQDEKGKEQWEIPVVFELVNAPVIDIEPEVLNFGDVYSGIPKNKTFTIINRGEVPLEITEILNKHPEVVNINFDNPIIEPHQKAEVSVTLDVNFLLEFRSLLTIYSNDPLQPEKFLRIEAFYRIAPEIDLENLSFLFAFLPQEGTETQEVPIFNFGPEWSILNYTIAQPVYDTKTPENKPEPDIYQNTAGNFTQQIEPDIRHRQIPDIPEVPDRLVKTKSSGSSTNSGKIIIFRDDMEEGNKNWQIVNFMETQSQWHIAKYNSAVPDHAWWCGNELTGTYFNDNTVYEAIISPAVPLPPSGYQIFLEFEEFFLTEPDFDQMLVEVSTDGGVNWQTIRFDNSGNSGGWITTTLDISDFGGSSIMIRFLFNTIDALGNAFQGWFIDNVTIYTPAFSFLAITPAQGTASWGGGYQMHTVTFNAFGLDPGLYKGFFLIRSDDPDESYYYLPAHVFVVPGNALHVISIPSGWSGLSSYVIPSQPAMEDVFDFISYNLIIAQTLNGVYYPGENINTIGSWVSHSAYKIKTISECTLPLGGSLETNKVVALGSGWNLLPVPVPGEIASEVLFNPVNQLVVAKDVAGTGVYWPQYGINTIPAISAGKSYFVYMSAPGTVDFSAVKSGSPSAIVPENNHLIELIGILPTPVTHILAVTPAAMSTLEPGTLIGGYDQFGKCYGITAVTNNQAVSLTLFGDDPTTPEKDGFIEGETIIFRTNSGEILIAVFDSTLPQTDGCFHENGLSAVVAFEKSFSVNNVEWDGVLGVYPNPTSGQVYILGLNPGDKISVLNMQGMILSTFGPVQNTPATIDLSGLARGVYYLAILHNGAIHYQKIILK